MTEAAKTPEAEKPSKTAKLFAPEGCTSVSHGGESYEVDAKTGTVEVPNEAVAELIPHGFTTSKPKAAK